VLVYGTNKGKEFYVGGEPETNFNPVVHNLAEMGDLNADDINFGLGFYLLNSKIQPIPLESIDKRFIQFEVSNYKYEFENGMKITKIGKGNIVKCSELKNSKISKVTSSKFH
jgi:hypothetical protein